jgi:hypothetical protein
MGVLNKLKGRMSGYNALTKGPGKEYEFEIGKDYTKDFDITGQKSKNYTSAQEAVSQGLAAGASQPDIYYEDRSQEIAEIGAKLGSALAGKIAAGENKRKKELDQLQKDNPDMTRGEARKNRRANKKEGEKNNSVRRSKDEHGVVTSFERIGPPPKNPSDYQKDTPSWKYNQSK